MRCARKCCGIEVTPENVTVAIEFVRPVYISQVQTCQNTAFFGGSYIGQQVVRPALLQAEVKPVGQAVA